MSTPCEDPSAAVSSASLALAALPGFALSLYFVAKSSAAFCCALSDSVSLSIVPEIPSIFFCTAGSTSSGTAGGDEEYIRMVDALKKTSLQQLDEDNQHQPLYTFPEEVTDKVISDLWAPDRYDPEDIDSALGIRRKPVREVKETPLRDPVIDKYGRSYGLGRRKSSTARVWLYPGTGEFTINKKHIGMHFSSMQERFVVMEPLIHTGILHGYDVFAKVSGGGTTGQSEAMRMALAVAVQRMRPDLRKFVKSEGWLRTDPRRVERKHPGRKKARKSFQWIKR